MLWETENTLPKRWIGNSMHNSRCFDTDSKHLHKSGIYIPPRVQHDFRGYLYYDIPSVFFYCACDCIIYCPLQNEGQHGAKPHAQTGKTKSIEDATEQRHGAREQRCVGMVQNKATAATKQRRIVPVQRNEKPFQQSCWKGFHLKIRWRRPTLPLAQYHRRGRA